MYNPQEPVTSTKKTIVDWLRQNNSLAYVEIIENHPSKDANTPDLPLKKPLISFGRSQTIPQTMAFNNYLGEAYQDGVTTEREGKILNINFDIHLWNGIAKNMGGEREVERLEEKLFQIFELEQWPDHIQYENFRSGDIMRDPHAPVFHQKCRLTVLVLIYKDTSGQEFEQFNVKGSVINE